eukprot:GHRQ01020972.1.p1 GENE.GHRQ01020972.1~~GHRQ01020972.1.p1  ORF type:complete len:107 (-),score=15.25 GHRQ01020972.1:951-1271(-)
MQAFYAWLSCATSVTVTRKGGEHSGCAKPSMVPSTDEMLHGTMSPTQLQLAYRTAGQAVRGNSIATDYYTEYGSCFAAAGASPAEAAASKIVVPIMRPPHHSTSST